MLKRNGRLILPLFVVISSLYFQQARSSQCVEFYGRSPAPRIARTQAELDRVVQSTVRDLTISLQANGHVTTSFENAIKKLKYQIGTLSEAGFQNVYAQFSKSDVFRGEIEQRMDTFLARYSELNLNSAQLASNLKGTDVKLDNKTLENLARVEDLVAGLHSDVAFFKSREDYLAKLKADLAADFIETSKYAEENRVIFNAIGQVKEALWTRLNTVHRGDEKLALMLSLFNAQEQKSIADQSTIDLVQNQLQKTSVQIEQLKQSIELSQALSVETALISNGLTKSRVQLLMQHYRTNVASIKRDEFKLTLGQRFTNWTNETRRKWNNISADAIAVSIMLGAVATAPISVYQDYQAAAVFNARIQAVTAESTRNVPEVLVQNLKNSENATQVGSAMLNELNPESIVFVTKYLPVKNKFGDSSVDDLVTLNSIFTNQKNFSRKFTKEEIRDLYEVMKIRKKISYEINEDSRTDQHYDQAYSALNEMVLRNQNMEVKK